MDSTPSLVRMSSVRRRELPSALRAQDVRFSDAFAEHVVERFSRPGDVVFDPFAGFGTTLLAAEALGRDAYGIEFDEQRVAYVSSLLSHLYLIHSAGPWL